VRKELAKADGQRKKFSATFSHLGKKINYHGHSEETILLKNVIDVETNALLTDHIWFSFTKGFQEAGIQPGDYIQFEARVKKYSKGYVNKRHRIDQKKVDYKLSHPTKIKGLKTNKLD
jgi:hypothetical protein